MIDIGDFLTSRKGRNGMAEDFVALMQAIAPEMAEAMARRAMVLTAIAESAPVGLNGKEIVLNTGDSLYFDSGLPHGMKALDGKTVRFLAIIM